MHHTIVGLEALHVPYADFSLPAPHTSTQTSYHNTSPAELRDRIKDATIIITTTVKLTAEMLSPTVTPSLQLVAVMASGTDCVDLEACKKRGIQVCNCPHAPTEAVSDHAIGLYFAARRKTVLMHGLTMAEPSEWKAKGSIASYLRDSAGGAPLSSQDEVCGIIGYGAIGKRIANLTKALGMEVLIADRKNANTLATPGSSPTRIPFAEVLKRSTVLFVVLPRTPETLNLISAAELNSMSHQIVIINVARGGVIDEHAVIAALKEGAIAGYATDVFSIEPAEGVKDSPLLSEENKLLNLTVSPHVAWYGERTRQNLRKTLKENIELWAAGTPQNLVV